MRSYQQFFAELKRRKVFKVAAVYGAASFVLLQMADLLGQGLRLGDTFLPFITAIVLLGFPLALILAWAFEVTPEGVQRTGAASAGEIEGILAQPASSRWPAGLMALAGVAALVAGAWWVGRQTAAESATTSTDSTATAADVRLAFVDPSEDPRPSIAVLPFADMSPEQDQEYFGDGMTEEILNTLAKVRDLRVSGRTSTFAYKGHDKDLRQIGIELGVDFLVEGSVRKAGNQLRITAQLIDAADGTHLWSDQYDRPMDDVFAIQTEIAEAIAGALRVPLGLDADESLVSPTADLAAYDLYLAGRRLMRNRGPDLMEAIRLFQAAIDRDSTWAPAWAALGEATEISVWYPRTYEDPANPSDETRRRLDAAEAAATRALQLDPRNASALVAMGSVHRNRGAWRESEAAYRRAIALDPDNAEAHQQYGELLGNRGRIAESVRAQDRATALDPAPVRMENLAFSLERDDRLEEALEVDEVALRRDPGASKASLWEVAGQAFASAGRTREALEVLLTLLREQGPPPGVEPAAMTADGLQSFVQAIAEAKPEDVPVSLRELVWPEMWARMGEAELALEAFGVEQFDSHWAPGIWLPAFDSLRSGPVFQELLSSAGFSGATLQRTPVGERTRPLILRESGE